MGLSARPTHGEMLTPAEGRFLLRYYISAAKATVSAHCPVARDGRSSSKIYHKPAGYQHARFRFASRSSAVGSIANDGVRGKRLKNR